MIVVGQLESFRCLRIEVLHAGSKGESQVTSLQLKILSLLRQRAGEREVEGSVFGK